MIPGHVVGIEARKLTRSVVTRVATATSLILVPATLTQIGRASCRERV